MEYKRGIPAYTDAEGNTYGLLVETKESCITDDDGKNLKDKLTEMHVVKSPDKITFKSQDGSTVAIAEPKNGLNIQGILNATGGLNVSQGTNLETTNIKNLLPFNFLGPDGDRKFRWFLDGNNVLKLQFFYNSRWNELFYFTNDGLLHLTSDIFFDLNSKGVHFRNSSNNANSFKILTTERNTLEAQVYVNGIWTGAIQVNSDSSVHMLSTMEVHNGCSINFLNQTNEYLNFRIVEENGLLKLLTKSGSGKPLVEVLNLSNDILKIAMERHINAITQFNNDCALVWLNKANGTQIYRIFGNSNEHMSLEYQDTSGNWRSAMYYGRDGVVHFGKSIAAPNIASATALLETQQEITEMDIQNIETQQSVTAQDISNIETQQLITEMDLERIGGQVA